MSPRRQLIDWHTHCYLPEHAGAASDATMRARGVMGGEAGPEHHRRGVVDGGAERFVVIKMPTRWGRAIANDFIAPYVARYPGRAVCFDSQDDAVAGIMAGKVKAGDFVVIRYEGPRGGPGMQELLSPTALITGRGLGNSAGLVTDGRFGGRDATAGRARSQDCPSAC